MRFRALFRRLCPALGRASTSNSLIPRGVSWMAGPSPATNGILARPPQSRGDEFVPLADHVAIFVHHRVPYADMAHALIERAAVAHRAGAFDLLTSRADDVALGRFAFHPVIPFISRHEFLGGVEHCGVVALAVEEGANPAREVPVDEFVGGVEHVAVEMCGDAEPRRPG